MVGHNSNEGISFTDPSIRSDEALVAQLKRGFPAIPDSSIEYLTQTLYPPVFDGSYPYTSQLYRRRTGTGPTRICSLHHRLSMATIQPTSSLREAVRVILSTS
jgi:hypothetical protein